MQFVVIPLHYLHGEEQGWHILFTLTYPLGHTDLQSVPNKLKPVTHDKHSVFERQLEQGETHKSQVRFTVFT